MKALCSNQLTLLWHCQGQQPISTFLTGNGHCKMWHGNHLGAFLDSILYELCNLLS